MLFAMRAGFILGEHLGLVRILRVLAPVCRISVLWLARENSPQGGPPYAQVDHYPGGNSGDTHCRLPRLESRGDHGDWSLRSIDTNKKLFTY